jgi:hypothetical protein
MKNTLIGVALVAALFSAGCRREKPESGPVAGTANLENLSPEERIKKVQNDPAIPEQYKQTYINSQRAQEGQQTK